MPPAKTSHFLVPPTPYPRLGLTAHIQFMAEGAMVLGAGLALQLQPFGGAVRLVELAANAAGKLGARWGGRRGRVIRLR